jgi:hypothetical protein
VHIQTPPTKTFPTGGDGLRINTHRQFLQNELVRKPDRFTGEIKRFMDGFYFLSPSNLMVGYGISHPHWLDIAPNKATHFLD